MSRRRGITIALLLMVVPLLSAVVTFAAKSDPTPWLARAKAGTTCLLPREEMRYSHMTLLKDLRDAVVREGERHNGAGGAVDGISSCSACHQSREQFCDRCHQAAGVTPDCFGCHKY